MVKRAVIGTTLKMASIIWRVTRAIGQAVWFLLKMPATFHVAKTTDTSGGPLLLLGMCLVPVGLGTMAVIGQSTASSPVFDTALWPWETMGTVFAFLPLVWYMGATLIYVLFLAWRAFWRSVQEEHARLQKGSP